MSIRIDKRLWIGFILAHILLYFSFHELKVFWYIFTASMLFLISFSIVNEKTDNNLSFLSYLFYGILSGIILFFIFFLGKTILDFFNLPFAKEVGQMYKRLAPTSVWHYVVLFFIIIPGEEIFWRGFVQKRLLRMMSVPASIFTMALMYTSAQIYSGTIILPLAAFVSGLFWGYLYVWKKSLSLCIVSHLVFDLFLFAIYPLN